VGGPDRSSRRGSLRSTCVRGHPFKTRPHRWDRPQIARGLTALNRAETLAGDRPGPYTLGRHDEARAEFARAASLTRNERERALLRERAGLH
jgi:predicted RNA polymerase sigma factor